MPSARLIPTVSVIVPLAIWLAGAMAACSQQPPSPDPSLSPRDVVKIQLTALHHNNKPKPDHGIEIVYRFASSKNKSHTGPFSHFASMVHNLYSGMLNWKKVAYAPIILRGDKALQRVVLVTAHNQRIEYIFVLSRQRHSPNKNCWLTESVLQPSRTGLPAVKSKLKRHAI